MPDRDEAQPLALDPDAASSNPQLPAFLARPPGAPVYHGFVVLDDVVVEGFTFGKISDFESDDSAWGDAFVIAPDGSRAGLVWEIGEPEQIVEIAPPSERRWGVYHVSFTAPMRTRDDARSNLAQIVGQLRERWLATRPEPPGA